MFPGTFLFASETEKEHPEELRDETPFPKRSKRSETERDERSLHGVPAPCSPVTSLFTCRTQREHPEELRHETPYPERHFRTPEHEPEPLRSSRGPWPFSQWGVFQGILERERKKISPKFSPHKAFLRPPRVVDVRAFRPKDVRAKDFDFLRCEQWGESFGPGRPPGYLPARPRDIPLKNFIRAAAKPAEVCCELFGEILFGI